MQTGDRPVVGSGVLVTQPGDASVHFEYKDLTYKLEFVVDLTRPESRTEYSAPSGKSLHIKCVNFADGVAWSDQVGTVDDQPLLLSFYHNVVGEHPKDVRCISFTFSMRAKK